MTDPKSTVLLVEDDEQMRKFVRISLAANGYRSIEAKTGSEGVLQAVAHTPELVLLDLGLPDMDGLEVVKKLREWSTVPIIVISARGQEESKVAALDAGADDYLTKPFGSAELSARIRVALRHAARVHDVPKAVMPIGEEIRVDLARRLVFLNDEEVHLTQTEYKLLVLLVKHAGMVLTHRQLLEQVWGPGNAHQMQYLRVYMTQLRHKLEKDPAKPRYFVTETGVGYRLKIEP